MGNTQVNNCRSICGFDIISSGDLRKTSLHKASLHRESFKKPVIKTQTTISATPTQNNLDQGHFPDEKDKSTEMTPLRSANSKRSPNGFHYQFKETKDTKEKQNLADHDFQIIQV